MKNTKLTAKELEGVREISKSSHAIKSCYGPFLDHIAALEEEIKKKDSAMERLRDNFIRAVQGRPVRDMAETLAECDAAR